eukprot:TRINITY_DN374_c2_g1_i1.p1 TRINITY_DN374_c2_g1~~TRINITY_DN374_c2_g1_i1.p1  ORF type:complete len:274 (+),score=36.43 TRINITY_DN374_c2_g1_i1:207-1028(+)
MSISAALLSLDPFEISVLLSLFTIVSFYVLKRRGSTVTSSHKEIVLGGPVDLKGFPHNTYERRHYSDDETRTRAASFYEFMNSRRSIRFFSDRPIPDGVLENIVLTAGTSPSGAHKQPWTFVVVKDSAMKRQIREAAEKEEKINYEGMRMNKEWQEDLEPLGTDWHKDFIDTVPALIVVFKQTYGVKADGSKSKHYYFERSVGIASGMLIAAIHNAGLCTLTHTPTPMGFLTKLLQRPECEKPYLLLPVGFAAAGATVPQLQRKPLDQIMVKF